MADVIIRAFVASNSNFRTRIWHCVQPYITTIFDELNPPSLNRAAILISPYIPWETYNGSTVIRWAEIVSAIPYDAELGPSVVDTLLQIASNQDLQPQIPVEVWAWLKKRPSLPPVCKGREGGLHVVRHLQGIGDVEILLSYYFLVWSEWRTFSAPELDWIRGSIGGDFGAVGMWQHREDLVGRLNQILGQLDRDIGFFERHYPGVDETLIQQRKEQYGELNEVVLQMDRRATETLIETLTRTPLEMILLTDIILISWE